MFKFIIASNGHAVSNIPPFATHNEAVIYIGNAGKHNEWEVVELDATPAEAKPVTCTCWDWAEEGQPSLECFGCDSGRLAPIDYVGMLQRKEYEISDLERRLIQTQARLEDEAKERAIDQANIKMYLAIIEDQKAKFNGVRDYIQSSIDREDWTSAELEEIFWEELADRLNLDLKQTEEVEINVTLTYSGTVTVPKGTDVAYLEIGNTWSLEVELDGVSVGEVTQDDTEVESAL
jgi:hypothetical protein